MSSCEYADRRVSELWQRMTECDSHHSVSDWLTTVNTSDGEAETAWRHLWDRYAPRVTALARERLGQGRQPLADEEDVVIEVFKELFRGMQAGRFPRLGNRDELQHILATITQRRAIDAARRNEFRGAHEVGESALPGADGGDSSDRPIDLVAAGEHPPDLSLLACEELSRLLDSLEDDKLRQVALMRVVSSTDREIAGALKCSVRTVQRKVRLIAQRWREVVRREPLSRQDMRQGFQSWQQANDPP